MNPIAVIREGITTNRFQANREESSDRCMKKFSTIIKTEQEQKLHLRSRRLQNYEKILIN